MQSFPRRLALSLWLAAAAACASKGTDGGPSPLPMPFATAGSGGTGSTGAAGSGGVTGAPTGGSGGSEVAPPPVGLGQAGSTAAQGGAGGAPAAPAQAAFVYVGGYNNQISIFSMDPASGALTPRGAAVDANPSPSFLAFAPGGKYLFAVNEADNIPGIGAGAVSAFRVDPSTGGLSFINRVSSQGMGPAHVSVDHTGKFVFVANYNSGTIAVLPVATDGTLGAAVATDAHGAGAQAHEAVVDASNQFLFTPNKGLSNISQYRFNASSGQITPNTPPAVALAAGAGTRHLAFHPTAPFAYAINELDDSMVALAFDSAQGTLTPLQTISTLPQAANGANNSCAEVQVAPSGNFVYGSNRGNDSIVIYSVNAQTGLLTLVGHQATGGGTPRSFHLDEHGKILLVANQNANEVVTFAVDTSTGLLTEKGSVSVQMPSFVGVLYQPNP